ncbi:MAG: glycosyl transferase, partial [Chloroflexi bacterium]|nr:glycosyl transferase [Chloroflexota bacterium]
GTLAFGGIIDHTGGALICKGDPALNRINKYIPQLPSSEFKGETLYLRIKRGDGYQIFSPYFVPTLDPYDRYECHVGLGYTRIVSEFYGIRTDVTIFVPTGDSRVIRDIQITNVSDQVLEIDAIPVVEYTHFDALKQFVNADWVPQTMQSKAYLEADGLLILAQYAFMRKETHVNMFTSNHPVSSFESDRKRFLGDNEYGTWANPLSLQQNELGNYEALRGDNIAALLHHLGVVQPGETVRLITQLTQAKSVEKALPSIRRYQDPAEVEQAFRELADFWDTYLSKLQVDTPDTAVNSLLNIHNPRQCHTTKNWSRYLSLYQLGLGTRGIGFRDSSQDVMGVLAQMPKEAKALIQQLLHVQKRNGSAMHQFNPLTMIGSLGEAANDNEENPLQCYGDDHLWAVLAVTAYLKETGDLAFLDEVIPYYDKDKDECPIESGTVLDHLHRAIEFTYAKIGTHWLPLLGFADWNDTVNLRAGAESLFIANQYGKALLEMIALAQHLGDSEIAARYAAYYEAMKKTVNQQAWDGAWYVRYFDADGSPIGLRANTEGQIYTNGQSWPVISGFAPPDRAQAALDSVYERLNTSKGIKLSAPGYDGFDSAKGGVTTYPPGAKENGGIFLHSNPWVIIAETIVGNGDRAFEYYDQINPAARNDAIDEFECEPYVYPQNILGDEHPQFGLARNSWLSGTASWAYQAGTQYILGIRPTYDGLEIDPCIPSRWDGFKATREFRGAVYQIEVQNPDHVCKGVRSVRVDGREIEGNVMPVFGDGKTHRVDVVMG